MTKLAIRKIFNGASNDIGYVDRAYGLYNAGFLAMSGTMITIGETASIPSGLGAFATALGIVIGGTAVHDAIQENKDYRKSKKALRQSL